MKLTRMSLSAVAVAGAALLLAGCGGGGGGGDNGGGSSAGAVIGKVVDMNGAVVPGASVAVEGNGPQTSTLSQGTYRLDSVPVGVQRIDASTTVKGVHYTGSTEALALENTVVSNANIQVSPTTQQATITGHVFDAATNHPLADARVLLAVTISASGDAASLVAFTDRNGLYVMHNVPTGVASYTAAASLLHYQNTKLTVTNLQPGETRKSVDFSMAATNGSGTLVAPGHVSVQSFTQPAVALGSARTAGTTSRQSVYERIRRLLSPTYARLIAERHLASRTHKLSHRAVTKAARADVIEMDVAFDNVGQPPSLAGFRIYNSEDADAPTPYDFLQDPLANFYVDSDAFYEADHQFNFAVSAFDNDGNEGPVSSVASLIPLGLLTVDPVQVSQGSVTFHWNAVNGISGSNGTGYNVFLFSEFPSIGSQPLSQSADDPNSPLSTTSYTTPLPPGDYWVVVTGKADNGVEITVSKIISFHV